MAGIQGNAVEFWMVEQTAIDSGVPTNPTWTNIPRTGGDIDENISTTTSNLTDTTRQGPSPVLTAKDVGGNIPSELQVTEAAFQNFVKGGLQNPIGTDINLTASTISFDNSGSQILDSGNGFTAIDVGEFFGVYGATESGNNQVYLVTAKADDGTLTVSPAPADESAGASITIKGKSVASGNSEIAYSVQKRIPGSNGTVYYTNTGVQVSSLSLSVTAASIITTSFDMIGLTQLDEVTQIPGSTDNAVSTDRIVGSVNGVPQLFMDNASIDVSSILATDLSFSVDNGSSGVNVVGKEGPGCIQHSAINVTGTLNTILGDTISEIQAEKIKASNQTEFQLGIAFRDADNNYLVVDFPTAIYTSLTQADTANGDLLQNTGSFQAHGKNSAGYTVRCTFIEAP